MTNRLLTGGVTLPAHDAELAATWVAVAHHVKRETLARLVGATVPPGPGQNYYSLQLVPRDGRPLRLMLNVTAGLVACSEDHNSPGLRVPHTPFQDVPRSDLFVIAGFSVADPGELESTVTVDDLAKLAPDERQDISYHQATRMGDVLFNWFD
jgi:hypothetical protein